MDAAPMKERAEQILVAADALFGDRGYDGVSVRDIADEAGVKKAAVFYYFDGKEDLLRRILDRYYAAHRDALADAFAAKGPLRARLHGAIDAYLGFMATNHAYARLVQGLVATSPDWHAHVRRGLEPLLRWTEGALAEVAPAAGPLAARHFFLTLSGAVINSFTYAPVLAPLWGSEPLSAGGLDERRAHLHFVADALLDRLERSAG